ncbi:NitT/TauT family transport system substrate-binding protein [Enhydrobacter aerosaccus]|uniref:Thiamine pyrimidine synthase n=1 Tax=Enhydrobacter aerosaccus TaxID=225324 RepID=A0A1T4N5Z9_9HYPH|nr:ABC transporter substrate-binding protein [Enhydrobacter aerosaccus]SJZ74730.1 NitT/TauT family transport system substrate-binding protein [Enhydrobacter aerosaccus]
MRKLLWVTAVSAALAVVGLQPGSASAQEKLSVRLDFSPWGVQAAMHLAKNAGWFKEAGLDVDIQDGRGSGNTIQLVNAGQADVGQVQVGLLGAARGQGAALRSIAVFERKTDLCVLVDRDAPLNRVADLKGKTLVVFAASPWAPLIDSYLKSGGLTRADVKVDFVDPAALWGTYIAKRADGLLSTANSALPIAEASRPSKCLSAADAGISYPSYGLVARDDTIEKKGAALRKLIQIEQRAWERLRTNPDDGVKAMIAERPDAKLDPKVLREQIKLTLDYFDTPATKGKPIGWQAKEDWEAALKSLEAAGVVKPGWKADDYFTNALLQ